MVLFFFNPSLLHLVFFNVLLIPVIYVLLIYHSTSLVFLHILIRFPCLIKRVILIIINMINRLFSWNIKKILVNEQGFVFPSFVYFSIDYSRICSNVRTHPEYTTSPVQCIQLHHPETLLIEYDQEYTKSQIEEIFQNCRIFHIKIYSSCAFVHFYCHDGIFIFIFISRSSPSIPRSNSIDQDTFRSFN